MPTGKRASMREGPLTALFRKTAQDVDESQEPARAPDPPEERSSPPAESQAPALAEPLATPGPPVEPTVPRHATPPEPEVEEPRIPLPHERLRHAFSADIPENVLERPAAEDRPAPQAPQQDVYAHALGAGEAAVPERSLGPVLRVVGVGGAGVNAINRMVEAEIEGVEFLAINTDLQSLQQSAAHETLHIGDSITHGLGSGSNPELGRAAAREEYDRIKAMLRGSDLVFIAAGAGGGTGTGAAPIVAQIARELGALTVGIITRPFQFEGTRRRDQAEAGIAELADEVDTLIVVPNNRLLSVLERNVSMVDAFRVADDVLRQGVQGISDLVTLPGLINLDFADVRTIMSAAGAALLGIGMGAGERRAIEAAERAVASPLLETSMEGAHSILLSITGGPDLSLWEVNEAAKAVAEAAHPDANIIFGAMVDEKLSDQVWVTVIATGYDDGRPRRRELVRDWAGEDRPALREPAGEPRVSRARPRTGVLDLDVPEFIPRR
ncbi:MAG TPA: cell division protein FtsZ [Solirubrobacteraceae bacterium]|nr:cell division protein FtsZ [Solirubrobacteraceae bacterium]